MGRVVRGKDGRVARVVDDADATEAERDIDEVATSIYCFRRGLLAPALRRITPENVKGEYYLTDVVAVLSRHRPQGRGPGGRRPVEAVGVNDRAQLAEAEAELRRRINERWMRAGVTMIDPAPHLRRHRRPPGAPTSPSSPAPSSRAAPSSAGRRIGPDTRLADCVVGEGAVVEQTVGHDAEIGAASLVGPFASLAAGSPYPAGDRHRAFYTARGGDDDGV